MKAQSQRRLRQIHFWLGLFFAPSIIFFALSGSIQALGFQDRSAGYEPPAWIKSVANVHKHGAVSSPAKRPASAPAPARSPQPKRPAEDQRSSPKLFSLFAVLLGLLLAAATALGIWIAFLNRRDRRTNALLLAAGTLVPILLLAA